MRVTTLNMVFQCRLERPHQAGYLAGEQHSLNFADGAAKSQRPPVHAIP
jgi:hypothetical protein